MTKTKRALGITLFLGIVIAAAVVVPSCTGICKDTKRIEKTR